MKERALQIGKTYTVRKKESLEKDGNIKSLGDGKYNFKESGPGFVERMFDENKVLISKEVVKQRSYPYPVYWSDKNQTLWAFWMFEETYKENKFLQTE